MTRLSQYETITRDLVTQEDRRRGSIVGEYVESVRILSDLGYSVVEKTHPSGFFCHAHARLLFPFTVYHILGHNNISKPDFGNL